MGIYEDRHTILGIRILVEEPINSNDYYIKYEYTGDNWESLVANVLPYYLGNKQVKIQTLHPFSSSHNVYTGKTHDVGSLWLDNINFKLEDLLK
jgi:hypothetical protein